VPIARLYDFAPNTTILSAEVDAELNQLVSEINLKLAVTQAIPATTKTIYYQAVAPTGWTRDISFNDKFIRIVSAGSPGTNGGAYGLGSEAAHTHTGPSHVHSGPSHTHAISTVSGQMSTDTGFSPTTAFAISNTSGTVVTNRYIPTGAAVNPEGQHRHDLPTTDSSGTADTGAAGTGATGAGSSHTHTHTSAEHAYSDVLLAAKDAY
jgi:hypothetical protein